MQYTEEIIDRKTGELVIIDKGDWITITELGELYNVGPRHCRSILRHMGLLHIEGSDRHGRHKLSPWVMDRNWGKRIPPRKSGQPFDVVGPDARDWIKERWQDVVEAIEDEKLAHVREAQVALEHFRNDRNAYRKRACQEDMPVVEMVSWLADHYPVLSHVEIGSILDVSQQVVTRHLDTSKNLPLLGFS